MNNMTRVTINGIQSQIKDSIINYKDNFEQIIQSHKNKYNVNNNINSNSNVNLNINNAMN